MIKSHTFGHPIHLPIHLSIYSWEEQFNKNFKIKLIISKNKIKQTMANVLVLNIQCELQCILDYIKF